MTRAECRPIRHSPLFLHYPPISCATKRRLPRLFLLFDADELCRENFFEVFSRIFEIFGQVCKVVVDIEIENLVRDGDLDSYRVFSFTHRRNGVFSVGLDSTRLRASPTRRKYAVFAIGVLL